MCADTPRHRVERFRDGAEVAPDVWHAKQLLAAADSAGVLPRPRGSRHLRPIDTKYAKFIGRVGALAVSLGVGVAVATTPGVAYATTESDSDAQSGSSNETPSKAADSDAPAADEDAAPGSPTNTAPEADDEDEDPDEPTDSELEAPSTTQPADHDDDETDVEVVIEEEDPSPTTPPETDPQEDGGSYDNAAFQGDSTTSDLNGSDSGPKPETPQTLSAPASPVAVDNPLGIEVPQPTAEGSGGFQPVTLSAPLALGSTSVSPVDALLVVPRTLGGMISGAISTILSPFLLVGSGAPVQTPLLWSVLAWVRREIVHTFFNRTPQVNVEQVVSQVPGIAIFDLNESDPNCDPVTTTITGQPEFGTVVKNLDGTFTYTVDLAHLTTGVNDSFTVTVTDSVGTHLHGVLGKIQDFFHRLAQFVGLAKPDTIEVTVPVTIPGIGVNLPPVLVVAPAAAVTAGDTVVLSPGVLLTDTDSAVLSGATVIIAGPGSDPSDVLMFTASNGITGAYTNGVLMLSGDASIGAYQAVLQSVSFSTGAEALVGLRSVTWSVIDEEGATSLPGLTEVVVIGVINVAPTVVATPVGVVTAGQSTVVSPVVVIVNDPGENLSGATVTITLGGDPSDELTFTASGGINGSYASGVLTLSGGASAASYQTVLQSVSFTTDASGLVGVRTIEFSVTDAAGQDALLPGVTALTVVGILNAAPTIVATPVGAVTAGQSTVVSPVVVIVNEPGENLSGATVTITLGGDGSDELTFTASGGITGSYANGVLTLTGSASAAAYQTVLQSVSFTTDASGLVGVRTIEFSITDAAGQDALLPGVTLVTVIGVLNAPPTIVATPVGAVTAGQSTVVSPVVVIVNEPGEDLSGATVTITLGSDPSDELTFTTSGGITGSYANGVLTLSGNASAATYQTVLQSVSFTTDASGLVGVRTIEFSITDAAGQDALLPGVTALTVVAALNTAPIVLTLPATVVTAGQSTTVSPIVTIVNDPGENLSGATVTITLGGDAADELTFTASNGITGSYANGVLTLIGGASASAYQSVLESVSFTTSSGALVGVRTIEFSVTDAAGQDALLPGITALTVIGVLNAPPTILTTPVGAVTAGQATTVSPVVTIVNDPGQNLSGATVTITIGADATDQLTFTPSNGVTGSYTNGVLTLTGSANAAAYQTVLQSVTFSTGSGALIGVRTIEFVVTDIQGASSLLPGVTALTVAAINLPPTVITSLVGNLIYNSGSPATTVDPLILVTDATSSKLSSVTFAITVGHDTDDVLSYTQPANNPVTAAYNSTTGVLTLTGDGTPAQYQQALRAVKFYTPQILLAGARTFTVFATDTGGLSSVPLLIALVILL